MNYIADVNTQLAMSKKNNRIFANITFTNNESSHVFFLNITYLKVKDGKGDEYDAIYKKTIQNQLWEYHVGLLRWFMSFWN